MPHTRDHEGTVVEITKMNVQQQSAPSFATMISILSVLFYCVGFFRVQLELNEHKQRINVLESIVESTTPPPPSNPNIKLIKDAPGKSPFWECTSLKLQLFFDNKWEEVL